MIILERFGKYADDPFFAIPYQHHSNKLTWYVNVGNGERTENIYVIALTPMEAVKLALANFRNILKMEKEIEKKLIKERLLQEEEAL